MKAEEWENIKEVFHAALELPGDKRSSFVDEACGTDESFAEQVKALLAAHNDADEFIESPALAPIANLVEEGSRGDRVGQVIGAYRIEREIGRGGMGAVYLGSRADKLFEKFAAIKLIKRGLDTDEIVARFRHERQILATLDHPLIARLIDGGATDDGLPYLIMDFVDGLPLTRYCNEKFLTLEDRLELFLKICSAVQYAHQNLVIHRDLKPSNILVTSDGNPRLLDFGIAKLITTGESHTINRTATNFLALTPEYASPEQVNGEAVTTGSDIYSLGVILYELLTGFRPFSFDSKSSDEITRIITDGQPLRPSETSIRARSQPISPKDISPGKIPFPSSWLRGDLDNIILMAMRKEPARRYSSVDQFASDIERFLNGLPVLAQVDSFSYRAEKFIKRNKTGVAAGVAVGISLIAGLVTTTQQAKLARRQRDKAKSEAQKVEQINQFLQRILATADPRTGSKDATIIDALAIAAESIETDFADQPDIVADLETTLGLTYLGLGQLDLADKFLSSALDIRQELYPRISVEIATSLYNYAKLLQAIGDLRSAEPNYREALNILRRLKGDGLEAAKILNSLGYLLAIKGESQKALEVHQDELKIRVAYLGEDHIDVANTLEKIGGVLSMMDQLEVSEPVLRRSLRIFQKNYGKEHPDIAMLMANLAATIYSKHPEEAESLCRRSLEMRRKLLGDDHADVAWSLYNLAYVLIHRGRFEQAEQYLLEALGRRGANLPDEHPVVASCLLQLGRICIANNDVFRAKELFEQCLDLRRQALPQDHWLLATTRSFLGDCLARLGENEIGLRMMAESHSILDEKLGKHHQQTILALERLRNSQAST